MKSRRKIYVISVSLIAILGTGIFALTTFLHKDALTYVELLSFLDIEDLRLERLRSDSCCPHYINIEVLEPAPRIFHRLRLRARLRGHMSVGIEEVSIVDRKGDELLSDAPLLSLLVLNDRIIGLVPDNGIEGNVYHSERLNEFFKAKGLPVVRITPREDIY